MGKTKLRIGYLPIVDHLILGITKQKFENQVEKNEFADIELVQKFGWNEVGDALIKGDIDVAFMLAPYAMDIYFAKKNIKLILLSHRDGSIIVTNKRANISSLKDFKNKTVLIPYQASMHHIIFHKLVQTEGLSLGIGKDVMTEVVAPGQIPMMIEYDAEGMIAGYIVAEPFGTMVVNAGFGNILKLSKDIMPSHPCCSIIARDEIVEKYPEAVQELVSSFVQSGLEVKTQLDQTIKTAMSFLNQKEDVVRTILEDPRDRVTTDKLLPALNELEDIQNYLIDTVTVPSLSGKIDVEKFVDLRFATAAGAK
jgi:NitT/TauT family transport system substrate-binding protein